MFRLVAYTLDKKILEKRHYLTVPNQYAIQTFYKEIMSQYGTEIVVVTEEVSYIEMGLIQ